MNQSILFSIIIPTYNRSAFILKTITALLNQTYTNLELIVVDDGSTDNTEELIAQIKDKRIKYFKKENGERGAARNLGIIKATGEYCTFIDSDDVMYPFALSFAFDQLKINNFPECYAQAHQIIRKKTGKVVLKHKKINEPTANQALLNGNMLSCIGVFIKRNVLEKLKFEENRDFAGSEDWLLWLRLSARYPVYYSNKICAVMQEHNERSVLYFSEEKLLFRAQHVHKSLLEDEICLNYFGRKQIDKLYAHVLAYTSLHLAISGKKTRAIIYWWKAVKIDRRIATKRLSLGILKTLILFNK